MLTVVRVQLCKATFKGLAALRVTEGVEAHVGSIAAFRKRDERLFKGGGGGGAHVLLPTDPVLRNTPQFVC